MTQMVIAQRHHTSADVLRWSAALLTAAAAAIHFAVMAEHFDQDWTLGVFFAAAAWAQLAWALLVVGSNDRRLLIAGVTGNVGIALVWVASRTTGLPFGPEPGARESAAFIDALATVHEIGAAASIVLLRLRERLIPPRRAAVIVVSLALAVIPITTAAIATGTDHVQTEQDPGRTHEQPQG